jgi:r-opsin
MFILNLAAFDFLMLSKMPYLIGNSFVEYFVGYETGCTIYAAIGSFSGIGGAITNAMIAFDRYK